jgi:hypothetical protein
MLADLDVKMDRQSEEADKRRAEADRRQAEWQAAADKRQEEDAVRRAEAAVTMEELKRTVDRLTKNVDRVTENVDRVTKNVGRFANTIGELVEILVAARLWEKFPEYDLARAYRQVPIYDENRRSKSEIDILLSDTDCAMAVEVKTSLTKTEQVDWHLKRMDLIRQYPPAEIAINNKRLMGAIAGGVVDASVAKYAQRCGLFVLELSGEPVRRLPSPAGFTPREW